MAAAQLRAPLYEDKVVDFLFSKADISDRKRDARGARSRPRIRARRAMSTARAAATTTPRAKPKAEEGRRQEGRLPKAEASRSRRAGQGSGRRRRSAKPKPAKPLKDEPAARRLPQAKAEASRPPRRPRREEGASNFRSP